MPAAATIDAAGLATGVSAGTATISATLGLVVGSTDLTVTAQPATHTLSGTVTANAVGLPGASVHVFDAGTYTWIGYAVTGAGGTYSIDLPAGTYKLFVQPDESGYADQWVGGSDHATASVADLSTTDQTVDVPLIGPPATHTLSGTVTANAVGLPGASVHVFDAGTYTWIGYAVTGAGGTYSIDLPAGTYKLFVQPDESGYADQWVGGSDHATASVADLSTTDQTVDVPLIGPPATHTLSGTVTANAVGLPGASVHVFDAGTYTWIGYAVTGAGGTYSIDLPAGTYKLFIQPDESGYADQWVGGSDHATATWLTSPAGKPDGQTCRWSDLPQPTPCRAR